MLIKLNTGANAIKLIFFFVDDKDEAK